MAKISPVSIKYMIHANFTVEGALEKPDVIGAIFGQTEGLLGSDLEMRELQKEGKIGRIEVDLERKNKMTTGIIKVPTALDQSETTLIAAAIETIERIGPCDSQIEVEKIEDVRGNKRDYIIDRAKGLMKELHNSTNSREISNEIKDSSRMAEIKEYGENKLPCGDISKKELIVVEGRADVLNLMRNGISNVIAMNGTKLPKEIQELSKEKEVTLFVDGDRGGKLIIQNVSDNAKVEYVAIAPDGKEVEELMGKEIWMALRKKKDLKEFNFRSYKYPTKNYQEEGEKQEAKKIELTEENKEKLKQLSDENQGEGKAIFLDDRLEEMKRISVKALNSTLRRSNQKPSIIIIDGTVTSSTIKSAEDAGTSVIIAKNFATTDTDIKLLSL